MFSIQLKHFDRPLAEIFARRGQPVAPEKMPSGSALVLR